MVGFGKQMRELQIPEWELYYINYKMMKKKLRVYMRMQKGTEGELASMRKEFARLLDWQIEKTVLFVLEQQGYLAARLAALREEREEAKDSGSLSRLLECIEAYHAVGMNLLRLLHFIEINATGLRKILKKFDKRVGHLTDYYVASRSNHPYSQLQQVFKHVGIGAIVESLTRSIIELRNPTKSIYDEPAGIHIEDPIIQSIKAAQQRLTNSTSFLQYVAKHALISREGELTSLQENIIEEQYHLLSLLLNLINTFLYMVNTYIIVPTADKYAESLGAAPTLCGVIIGSMAVSQLVSSIYLSAWSNKSYFKPLFVSSVVFFLGNVFYAVAYDWKSLNVLIIGRILCGLGSARAVNRRYISDWVPTKKRLEASAAFVTASALGMAAGPALAGLFEVHKSVFGMSLNANTFPGWFMAVCWLVYSILLWVGLTEPVQVEESEKDVQPAPAAREDGNPAAANNLLPEAELQQPLLENGEEVEDYDDDEKDSEESDASDKPANSVMEAYKLLTTPVKVQLLIYFMLKYAMEIVLSESSVMTSYYFGWTTRAVALFLAVLGLTVLPVNFLVGKYISNIFEERQILFASEVATCLGLLISFDGPIPYTTAQYISGSMLTFVSAEVLEGVNLALLSKVMPSRLARGTYNNGLLSTEAGTLARVVADGTITLAGYLGTGMLLNVTLAPSLALGIITLAATYCTYNSLF